MSCLSDVYLPLSYLEKTITDEGLQSRVQSNLEKRYQKLGFSSNDIYALMNFNQYKPIIVLGPSGVGKSTLINALVKKYPSAFGFSVSYTTRSPRPGEVDGVNYNFVTKDKFKQMILQDDFIEWAEVHTNMYGTAKSQIRQIQAQQKIPLLDIDVQGTENFLKAFPETNTLFIFPPSKESIEKRLRGRGTETEATLKTRVDNATTEMAKGLDPHDPKHLIGHRMINDDIYRSQTTFVRLIEALYKKELKL